MKKLNIILVGMLIAGLLAGCGDDEEQQAGSISLDAAALGADATLSETEQAIKDYESRYGTGEFTMEDYYALSELYEVQGLIRRQRDVLEQSYRLYDDTQAFETLQNIYVNLSEEKEAVRSEAQLMLQNLELEEYLDESVNLISSEQWLETMMPKLYEGKRNYFLQNGNTTALTIQVGYDGQGTPFSKVWYSGAEGRVTLLQRHGNTVKMQSMQETENGYNGSNAEVLPLSLSTQEAQNGYNGAFQAWTCEGGTGNIFYEQGTLKNGVYTGDYMAKQHTGTEGSDVFSLWSNRQSMEYTVYTGRFNGQGNTTLPQLADGQRLSAGDEQGNYVIYAYDEQQDNCLFVQAKEGTEPASHVFTAEDMGWDSQPEFAVYEAKQTTQGYVSVEGETPVSQENPDNGGADTASELPKVRIFDGEIQCLVEGAWINMGSVAQYEKQDPFRVYAENKGRQDGGSLEAGETDTGNLGGRHSAGQIIKPTPTPAATPKPTTKPKPAATPTPAPTPAPQAPAPQQPDPTPEPTPEPTPWPTPTPAPSQNEGGDVDIEWSPDIM